MIRNALVCCFAAVLAGTLPVQAQAKSALPASTLVSQGLKHLKRGEYDEAIAKFTRVLNQSKASATPSLAKSLVGLGMAFSMKGEYERAIAPLDRAIRLVPKAALPYRVRGEALKRIGEYDRALADFDKVISLKPDRPSRLGRSEIYLIRGDHQRAITEYEASLRIQPEEPTSEAMTFVSSSGGREIIAFGKIELTTPLTFKRFIKATDLKDTPATVLLNSNGGTALAGAMLGILIREAGFSTTVGSYCVSACVLAFLGGVERHLEAMDQIGVHQSSLKGADGKRRYSRTSFLPTYIRLMGVEQGLADAIEKVPFDTIRFLTRDEMVAWNVITEPGSAKPALVVARPKLVRRRAELLAQAANKRGNDLLIYRRWRLAKSGGSPGDAPVHSPAAPMLAGRKDRELSTERAKEDHKRQASADVNAVETVRVGNVEADDIEALFPRAEWLQLIKREFPVWYRERLQETARLRSEGRRRSDVTRRLTDAIVALRRQYAEEALAASPAALQRIAQSFLGNLQHLSEQSVEACYGFISQGERSPYVVDLMASPEHADVLQRQVTAVFRAIMEGRRSPHSKRPPRQSDYQALTHALVNRGWTDREIQIFSSPAALAKAPPEVVCKLVQDWFAAQLSVADQEIQLRLLFESLKPVVAG